VDSHQRWWVSGGSYEDKEGKLPIRTTQNRWAVLVLFKKGGEGPVPWVRGLKVYPNDLRGRLLKQRGFIWGHGGVGDPRRGSFPDRLFVVRVWGREGRDGGGSWVALERDNGIGMGTRSVLVGEKPETRGMNWVQEGGWQLVIDRVRGVKKKRHSSSGQVNKAVLTGGKGIIEGGVFGFSP